MLSGFLLTIQVYLITLTTSTHVTQKVFCLTICLTFHLKNLTLHVLLITLNGNLKLAIFSRGAQSPSQLKPGFKKTLLILRSCSLLPRSWQATQPSFWGETSYKHRVYHLIKWHCHGSFTEPWLYRAAWTWYYSVLQKVPEEEPFEHVGFPRAHSGCGDFLANVYFGKVELFFRLLLLPCSFLDCQYPSWLGATSSCCSVWP